MLGSISAASAQHVSIIGAPEESGFNAGSTATLRAGIKGLPDANATVEAQIWYAGASSRVSIPLTNQHATWQGGALYTGRWNIPENAPTGLYRAAVQVSNNGSAMAHASIGSFAVYRKYARIVSITLNKTFYAVGEPIECEITLENLTGRPLHDLRVEFSNPNYPWIATFSGEANLSGSKNISPMLALKVLRSGLSLPARGRMTLRMQPAGTAAFLQGTQRAVLGAGAPPRHDKVPPPEIDRYTVALWNHDRTVLYDMQFSPIAIVRSPGETLPKPYSDSFTHPYNDEIDFTKYRHFYAPGEVSSEIVVDHAHTLYRPGDTVHLKVQLRNPDQSNVQKIAVRVAVEKPKGPQLASYRIHGLTFPPGGVLDFRGWRIPASISPGMYSVVLSTWTSSGVKLAQTSREIGVNRLPSSILVFCPHEDDELPWAGLIRAAVESGIPVHVIFFTGGDVGECERYYGKPCGPNDAREFGMVRMEESKEALEHIGLPRTRDIFLGLPDGGSQEIWFHHREASNPFLSVYLAVDHAPYADVLEPNLPYARKPVVDVVKKLIVEYHPALIATPHPDERHVDHRTANWFVVKACQELLHEHRIDPATLIVADQAYGAGGYHPAPYHYQRWVVHLSGEAAALKQEMSWIYQSQDGNLSEGMKRTFNELPREEVHYRILDWQQHEGWNEKP